MPMVKDGTPPDPNAVTPSAEPEQQEAPRYERRQRDFDAEARGKTACAVFCAALQSQGLTLFPAKTFDEYLLNVRKAADAAFNYAFEKQDGGK